MDKWKEIWMTITKNKSRSILTAFGVFWGMFMLVAMVGLGNALENGIFSKLSGFATNSCFFESDYTAEPYRGFKKGRYWSINNADLNIIKERVPEVDIVTPIIFGGSSENNVVYNDLSGTYRVKGQIPNYQEIESVNIKYGRYINDIDILEKRKVCIIGENVYKVLFPHFENPIGQYIRVNGIYFQIVGVLSGGTRSINIGGRPDETVLLPLTTMQQAYNMGDIVHLLAVTTKADIPAKDIEQKVSKVLKQQHQISPTDKSAVMCINLEEQFNMFKYLGMGISALIWLIGIGTLLAGAIGVSNIMLVTVRERTKEIGIRRAIGASPRNIAGQIIAESVVLTSIAGLVGMMLGVLVLRLMDILTAQGDGFFREPQIAFSTAIGALVIIVVIGIMAGLMPAFRALGIKPIEAIREE